MVEVPSLNMNDQEEEDRPWEELKRPLKPPIVFDTTKSSIEVKRSTWDVITPTDATMTESIKKKKKKKKKRMKKEKKEKEEEQENLRQWDALPSTALVNIFCKSELRDRLQSIPLVCKSWKSVTDDPRCWSSMIPDSVSLEDAFIKNSSIDYDDLDSYRLRLFKKKELKEEEKVAAIGVSRLQTLLKKSGGGAAITTLYISAFVCSFQYEEESKRISRAIGVIRLIANSCPNLKHISFNMDYDSDPTYDPTYAEALLQLFKRCKKLELVDLSYFGNGADPSFIQEMGSCLPNLRGIQIQGGYEPILASIGEYLPQLKLLCLHDSSYSLDAQHLSMTLFSRLEFQYLYVLRYEEPEPEPDFDYYYPVGINRWHRCSCSLCDSKYGYSYKTDNFVIDDYHDILKQRKENQYVSILKEKKEYHHTLEKKKEDLCNSSLKKKKKKDQYDSSLKKKKKDQCNYADFVIQ